MCIGMAIDLALHRSSKDAKAIPSRLFSEEVDPCNRNENFTRPLEKERTWLAVFVVTVGYLLNQRQFVTGRFAVGMRRPQSLEWTPHHSYCCQTLLEGGQTDAIRLVHICRLLKLSQDVGRTFCYDTRPKSPSTKSDLN